MTAKKVIVAAALLAGAMLGVSTASYAQVYYGGPYGYPYGYQYGYGGGLYDYYGPSRPDWMRGGPGPRVQDGSGMGVGDVR